VKAPFRMFWIVLERSISEGGVDVAIRVAHLAVAVAVAVASLDGPLKVVQPCRPRQRRMSRPRPETLLSSA